MEITHAYGAGLDVHKKTVVAWCLTPSAGSEPRREMRTFSTMTQDLLALSDWLMSQQVTHVAMESTGEFWKPVYNVLEGTFTVLVVNAHHLKHVPGRKTDVKDAEWIATLLRHGLLRGSFIPPRPQRDLRDLTRQRTNLVQNRAMVVNHLHKVLEGTHLKLTAVVTDVTGVSARAMLEALIQGQTNPQVLADLAQRRLRSKRAELEQALVGVVREHHRLLIAHYLSHLDFLDEELTCFNTAIVAFLQSHGQSTTSSTGTGTSSIAESSPPPNGTVESALMPTETGAVPSVPIDWEQGVRLLDTIPGIGRGVAEVCIAELGTDMTRFPSAAHLASWARVCPGTHESAGKRTPSGTGQGNAWLRRVLIQAAHAAIKVKDSYFASVYHRLVPRRGGKRAIMAVAHRILRTIYHVLSKRESYRDAGVRVCAVQRTQHLANRLRHRLEQLGYTVHLELTDGTAA